MKKDIVYSFEVADFDKDVYSFDEFFQNTKNKISLLEAKSGKINLESLKAIYNKKVPCKKKIILFVDGEPFEASYAGRTFMTTSNRRSAFTGSYYNGEFEQHSEYYMIASIEEDKIGLNFVRETIRQQCDSSCCSGHFTDVQIYDEAPKNTNEPYALRIPENLGEYLLRLNEVKALIEEKGLDYSK